MKNPIHNFIKKNSKVFCGICVMVVFIFIMYSICNINEENWSGDPIGMGVFSANQQFTDSDKGCSADKEEDMKCSVKACEIANNGWDKQRQDNIPILFNNFTQWLVFQNPRHAEVGTPSFSNMDTCYDAKYNNSFDMYKCNLKSCATTERRGPLILSIIK